jgi:hypothetical protein
VTPHSRSGQRLARADTMPIKRLVCKCVCAGCLLVAIFSEYYPPLVKVKASSKKKNEQEELLHLGRSHPFRLVKCDCLHLELWTARCIGTDFDNREVMGEYKPYLPSEPFDMSDLGIMKMRNITYSYTPEEVDLVLPGTNSGPPQSVCKRSNKSNIANSSGPHSSIVYIQPAKPEVIGGIYHQFLAGLLPSLSFLFGICDGTVEIDQHRIHPQKINHWIINQGPWSKRDTLPSYIIRVWDAIRPELQRVCRNPNATFEMYRSNRNVTADGPDPYPPTRPFQMDRDSAELIVYANYRNWYTLRPSHANLLRNAVLKATKVLPHDILKVAVIDRKKKVNRNIVYRGSDESSILDVQKNSSRMGDGKIMLYDTVRYINSSLAPSGRHYTVARTFYTNDLGMEGIHQMDFLSDVDVVLWTHGQQQSNVLWLPECAITLELLAHRQFATMYNFASVQTGHIYGYVYTAENIQPGDDHAGLSDYPQDLGTQARFAIRSRPVPVNFTSVRRALSNLLSLRWQCLQRGLGSLPAPNITQQVLDFSLGRMGHTKNVYGYGQ